VGEHRVVSEGERTAEGLDGPVRVIPSERGVPVGDELLEFSLLAYGVPGADETGHEDRESHGGDERALHEADVILAEAELSLVRGV
jgi:hypothetical protein